MEKAKKRRSNPVAKALIQEQRRQFAKKVLVDKRRKKPKHKKQDEK